MKTDRISVIVPMFNASKSIERCLASIYKYADDQVEVIVVDDCSTDDTLQEVKDFPCTVVQLAANVGAGRARTEGAKVAQGELLFFLDSDVILTSNVFPTAREKFRSRPSLGALQGWYACESAYHDNLPTIYKDLYYDFFFGRIGSGYVTTVSTHCLVVRKEAFEALGGFNPQMRRAAVEDGEFGFRFASAAHPIYLDRSLEVTHLKRYTLRSLLRTDFVLAFDKVKMMLRNIREGVVTKHGGFNVMLNSGRTMLNFLGAIALSFPLAALGLTLPVLSFPVVRMAYFATGVVGFYVLLSPLLVHIARLKGLRYMLTIAPVIYLDCLIMMMAIFFGIADFALRRNRY
jgi:GT2 family glycosyltransferase